MVSMHLAKATEDRTPIFADIQALLKYSATLPEKPAPDGTDWYHATYKNFFLERTYPTMLAQIKSYVTMDSFALNIAKKITNTLNALLQNLIQERRKLKYSGHYLRIIKPTPGEQFIIITNLNGAFHSLVRMLDYCIRNEIMDETFHVKKPYNIIFNGNILTDSPYGIDTLALILQLKNTSPDHLFLVRGAQENKGSWQKTNLGLEMKMRLSSPQETTPLLDAFMDTLTNGLYLVENVTETSADLVRISNYTINIYSFDENNYSALFTDPKTEIIHLDEPFRKNPSMKVHLRALLRGSPNPTVADKGLVIEEKKNGTLIWQAQAGTTSILQVLHRYFNESFIIMTVAPQLADWSLRLYSHDVRTPGSLEAIACYNLLTGTPILDTIVQKNKIQTYEKKKGFLENKLRTVSLKEKNLNKKLEKAKQQEQGSSN